MEKQSRIYMVKHRWRKWWNILLLMLSAVLLVSGLFSKTKETDFSLVTKSTQTPVPMDEAFDETPSSINVELPEYTWYALQLGVFESKESAQQAAGVFQTRGAAGYIWQDGRYRVLASVYPSQEDAQLVREQLNDRHSIETYLYTVSYPAVHMRLSGMQGQLEILKASFDHAMDIAVQLQKHSVAMDRQEMSVEAVKECLDAMKAQADIVSLRLEQRFPKPYHATVQALMECFADFSSFAAAFTGKASAVETGIQLKYQTFVTLQKILDVYQTLSQT